MFFKRIAPDTDLNTILECYWIAEDDSIIPKAEKIIPDGFPEIIFHYGDPYRINISGNWEIQPLNLVAGQISRHFFLENTGATGIIGIKLKPSALAHLYGLNMHSFTDEVVSLDSVIGDEFKPLVNCISSNNHEKTIHALDEYFRNLIIRTNNTDPLHDALALILGNNGMTTLVEVRDAASVGERQLENLFKKNVGLSPKLFMRIVRFSYIFQLVQQNDRNWSSLAYEAAYYDQSHFIRNFKDFTGENPGDYAFDEHNLANFFLRKK
jgi:AraC-like DNA-binding protein